MKKRGRNKECIAITISREILQRIDEDRGLIPRSAYIDDLLKKSLV